VFFSCEYRKKKNYFKNSYLEYVIVDNSYLELYGKTRKTKILHYFERCGIIFLDSINNIYMNIPQSSTDYIEKIRAKRTKEYDIRVEEYFSDNKKIIEINKYLAVRGIKNTVKKYGLDKEDMSDIVFSYLDSLLECEEELLLIQAKILQASEEQKEDVILGIQREY